MYNPYLFNPLWLFPIPDLNLEPPTIYSFLESIVNYGKDEKTKIKDLAKIGRTEIFDFDYPLSSKVSREYFESQILNHYLMRRIGFETLTAFKIQLNCKLNEIMPIYNKLFDSIDTLDFFGPEITTRIGEDYSTHESRDSNKTTLNSEDSLNSNTISNGSNTNDIRRSDTPQSNLQDVRDGSYVTNYEYDTGTNTNNSDTNSSNSSNSNGTSENNSNSNDNKNYNETVTRSLTGIDRLNQYKEIQENLISIFKLIYKELDCLFYGLV